MNDPIPAGAGNLQGEGAASEAPSVWLLTGPKPGDNTQVLALAEGLGWPYVAKRFAYRPYELLTNRLLGATLAGTIPERSSPLAPPWPDLILSAGRRNEPVARWIRRQAGYRPRLVHMGRPWSALEQFDLVVTTPQYALPDRPGILHNTLPLHRVTPERLAAAASAWGPRLGDLPRPRLAVLVGGHSGAFTFGADLGSWLGHTANGMAAREGGSVLVTTSARTPSPAATALEAAITVPAHTYRWRPQAQGNPYFGYLALADAFIVTGDSMSMLTEAVATGRAVYICPLSARRHQNGVAPATTRPGSSVRPTALLSQVALAMAPRRMRRDITAVHRHLISSGHAVWLGDQQPLPSPPPPPDDLGRTVARVRALFPHLTA